MGVTVNLVYVGVVPLLNLIMRPALNFYEYELPEYGTNCICTHPRVPLTRTWPRQVFMRGQQFSIAETAGPLGRPLVQVNYGARSAEKNFALRLRKGRKRAQSEKAARPLMATKTCALCPPLTQAPKS